MTTVEPRAFGRATVISGCLCAALLPLVILEMSIQLPYMPDRLWRPAGSVQLPLGQFDLRMMVICPGPIGWLGGWGYLVALVWLPIAAYKAWRAWRQHIPFGSSERVLLVVVPTLLVMIELMFHLTPLRYGYPLL
jgi:hypothetical protein